jgi:hypothetical protein
MLLSGDCRLEIVVDVGSVVVTEVSVDGVVVPEFRSVLVSVNCIVPDGPEFCCELGSCCCEERALVDCRFFRISLATSDVYVLFRVLRAEPDA